MKAKILQLVPHLTFTYMQHITFIAMLSHSALLNLIFRALSSSHRLESQGAKHQSFGRSGKVREFSIKTHKARQSQGKSLYILCDEFTALFLQAY